MVLVLSLKQGEHSLKFIANGEADVIKEPEIKSLNGGGLVTLLENISSEEKNCQPWITVALIGLSLKILDVAVRCQKRFIDSDDVKLVINNQIQKNEQSGWWGKNWFWRGRKLQGKIAVNRFYYNFLKIINPLDFDGANDLEKKSWKECYEIADSIISGKIANSTEATHFHGIGVTREWFEKKHCSKG